GDHGSARANDGGSGRRAGVPERETAGNYLAAETITDHGVGRDTRRMTMVDANLFKQVMRRYATGVMVLTVREGEGMHAVTVNSVTSVSLEPPLVLVCIEKNARSHELVRATGAFALNILSAEQMEAGKKFAYEREARSE